MQFLRLPTNQGRCKESCMQLQMSSLLASLAEVEAWRNVHALQLLHVEQCR